VVLRNRRFQTSINDSRVQILSLASPSASSGWIACSSAEAVASARSCESHVPVLQGRSRSRRPLPQRNSQSVPVTNQHTNQNHPPQSGFVQGGAADRPECHVQSNLRAAGVSCQHVQQDDSVKHAETPIRSLVWESTVVYPARSCLYDNAQTELAPDLPLLRLALAAEWQDMKVNGIVKCP
jgi:hypothetical protein